LEGIDSAKVLKRLVNMQFVRKEGTHYYLHPVDREYALSRIPKGEPDDRFLADHLTETEVEAASVFSQYALLNRGAQYFKEIRLPRKDWKSLDDLDAQLAEFELRFQSQDYDTALGVLLEIDFDYLMLWGHSRQVLEYHLRLQGKIEDDSLKKDSLSTLGFCYDSLGDYPKAIEHYQQSLDIAREIGDRGGEGNSLGNLGGCYYSLGDYPKAIEHHQQSLDISREIGDRDGQGHSLNNLACALLFLGDTELAQAHLNTAAEIWEETGSPDVVEAYVVLGISLLKSGQYQKGKKNLEKARRQADTFLEQASRVETIDLKALALCGLAVCEHDRANADKAREAFAQARAITKAKGQMDRVLKFFDLIVESDDRSLLAGVREVATGTEK